MEPNEIGILALAAKRYDQLRRRVAVLSKEPGPAGDRGPPGKDGADGKDGERGPVGPPPAHRWQGTRLSLKKPDGAWGRDVDLRGPSGGVAVVSGGGSSAPQREPVLHTDYSDTRFAYVGFASRIARIDYSVSPPAKQTAWTGDWANRLTLDYC